MALVPVAILDARVNLPLALDGPLEIPPAWILNLEHR